jgi:hypothetical protein
MNRALQNRLWQRLLDLAEAPPTRRLVRRTGRLLARYHRTRVDLITRFKRGARTPLATLRRLADRARSGGRRVDHDRR